MQPENLILFQSCKNDLSVRDNRKKRREGSDKEWTERIGAFFSLKNLNAEG